MEGPHNSMMQGPVPYECEGLGVTVEALDYNAPIHHDGMVPGQFLLYSLYQVF